MIKQIVDWLDDYIKEGPSRLRRLSTEAQTPESASSVRYLLAPPQKPISLLPLLPTNHHHHHRPSGCRPMLVMFIAFLVAAFVLLSLRFPAVWSALMAIDEPSDHRELGLVVASRTCFPRSFPHPLIPLIPTSQGTLSVKVALRHAWPSSS